MITTLSKIVHALDQTGIPYLVGDESLLGLSEGNIEKYKFNITLYQIPTSFSILRYFALGIILIFKGITVKPKFAHSHFRLKIRVKPSAFTKAPNFIFMIPLKKSNDQFVIVEQGRTCNYPIAAILPLTNLSYKNQELSIPHDLDTFVSRFKTELLSSSYRKHPVVFNDKSALKAEEILFKIAHILNTQKSHWWLEGGTLLGLYRDGKLLDWDHDVDLGVQFESEEQIENLLTALKRTIYYIKVLDFTEKDGLWNLGKVRLIKIFPRRYYFFHTDLCLDLFIFYREALENVNIPVYKYVVHQRNGYHPASLLDNLEDLTYKGHRLGRPAKSDAFLESKYGENWKTPVKEWHVAIDDKTILNNMKPS